MYKLSNIFLALNLDSAQELYTIAIAVRSIINIIFAVKDKNIYKLTALK